MATVAQPVQQISNARCLRRLVYITYLDDSGSSGSNLKDEARFQVVTAVLVKDSDTGWGQAFLSRAGRAFEASNPLL